MSTFLKLLLSFFLVAILYVVGGLSSARSIDNWYTTLNLPIFNPPDIVFAIVWPILYILIGLSLFAMLNKKGDDRVSSLSYILYFIQYVLNGIWSYLFFTLNNLNLALIDIYLLLLFIILYMLSVRKTCRAAFYMFIPYFLWVLFASILFTNLWLIN